MTEAVEELMFAKKLVQWAAIGATPSQENALRASQALRELEGETNSEEIDASIKSSVRMMRAMAQGMLPSQDLCDRARASIEQLIEFSQNRESFQLQQRPRA
jgi:hypothetical protein